MGHLYSLTAVKGSVTLESF